MNNREKIARAAKEAELDAILLTSNSGRRYATGSTAEGAVLITASGEGYAYTDSRYLEALEGWAGPLGYAVSLPENMRYTASIERLVREKSLKQVGFEEDSISLALYTRFKEGLSCALAPAGDLLARLREVKDPEEVENVEAAQRIAERALEDLISELRPGRTERKLAAFLDYRMAGYGSEGTAFPTILLSGARTSLPHGEPGDKPLREGEFILIDFGARVNGYCSDMTRTLALGQPSGEMRRVYDIVLAAQEAGIAALEEGRTGSEVHEAAHRIIREQGYGEYFGHGLGHSLGLDIHERPSASPSAQAPFRQGNILTVEPGIYLPGRFGVRIEDMIYLSPGGKVNLTRSEKALRVL